MLYTGTVLANKNMFKVSGLNFKKLNFNVNNELLAINLLVAAFHKIKVSIIYSGGIGTFCP